MTVCWASRVGVAYLGGIGGSLRKVHTAAAIQQVGEYPPGGGT
jgi:hypothetical protein